MNDGFYLFLAVLVIIATAYWIFRSMRSRKRQ